MDADQLPTLAFADLQETAKTQQPQKGDPMTLTSEEEELLPPSLAWINPKKFSKKAKSRENSPEEKPKFQKEAYVIPKSTLDDDSDTEPGDDSMYKI